jgi:hypothetical protein
LCGVGLPVLHALAGWEVSEGSPSLEELLCRCGRRHEP